MAVEVGSGRGPGPDLRQRLSLDEDLETEPPSDREESRPPRGFAMPPSQLAAKAGPVGEPGAESEGPLGEETAEEEAARKLREDIAKMDALNMANELDTRSVSGSRSEGEASPPASSAAVSNCAATANGVVADAAQEDEDLDLWAVWGDLVKNWPAEMRKRPAYVRELVRRGIPCHFRTIAWQLLSAAQDPQLGEAFQEYLRTPSPHEKVILRDVSRTYPEHDYFKAQGGKGQTALFNVMKAYSVHDREVGYCQGSAFIAGQLLLQMPEEEAFAVLVRLMEGPDYRLRELYKPAMTELGLAMFQLECLVQEQLPDLHQHFLASGFDTSMYASSWFLTLFTTQLPLPIANRIMDVFISEGMEVVFRLAIAILQSARVELLQRDMEGMLKYFQREVGERLDGDCELLFHSAFNVSLNAKKMKRLEKDYLAKRTKEQEEAVELRRLRTENRLLRQRLEYVEAESGALASRLVEGQVSLAQEAENSLSITHQLHKLRTINADVHRQLEDAYATIAALSTAKTTDGGAREAEVQVEDDGMLQHIHSLQENLIETTTQLADLTDQLRELKQRCAELEAANKRLKETPPDHCVASLQEELISVKMREAEASLSLKEMRQKLADLEADWVKYVGERSVVDGHPVPDPAAKPAADSKEGSPRATDSEETAPSPASSAASKLSSMLNFAKKGSLDSSGNAGASATQRELEDQLMGVKIREADTLAELKEMRQKVMELETQNHVCTNQIRRQDEEQKRVEEELDVLRGEARGTAQKATESKHALDDAHSALKEAVVAGRIRESELLDKVASLETRLAGIAIGAAEASASASLAAQDVEGPGSLSSLRQASASLSASRTDSLASDDAGIAAFADEMRVRLPDGLDDDDVSAFVAPPHTPPADPLTLPTDTPTPDDPARPSPTAQHTNADPSPPILQDHL